MMECFFYTEYSLTVNEHDMNVRVISAIMLLCLIWGSLWGVVKQCLLIFSPFLFTSIRLILGAVVLMAIQYCLGRSIFPERSEWRKLIYLSLLFSFGFYALQSFAMQFVDSGISAVLVFTMPIIIAVLAHYFLNERLNIQKGIGLLLGTIGLAAILWKQLCDIHFNLVLLGEFLLIISAFFWASFTIYIKIHFLKYDKIKLTIWQMMIGGLLLLIFAVLVEPLKYSNWYQPVNLLYVFYTSVIGTSLTYLIWSWVVSKIDAFVASISIMSVPILGLLFGYWLWNEALTLNIVVGALCICIGIIFSSFSRKKRISVD